MKTFWLILGGVVLAALWFGPLPTLAQRSFAAHMALHMGLVAVAAPLIAFGLAGGRCDPARHGVRWLPPVPLSMLELVVVWAWHAPALHRAARHSATGFAAEQASFLLCGLLVWLASVGGAPRDRDDRTGAGIAALLLTSMHMTILGALLALTPRPLYAHAGHGETATWSALDDQQLGGAIMLAVGGASYLAGGLWLTARLVRRRSMAREVRA